MNVGKLINLNRFIKLDKISEESFSVTYKVKEKKTKQLYAATVYDVSNTSNDLILSGIDIHSTINHPAIARFTGYSQEDFESNSNPVIITEFYSNGALQDLIAKSKIKQIKFDESWDFTKKFITIYGIASAMSYLHKNGIIHRNLNPNNIYMDNNLYPKISNFGLAKRTKDLNLDDTMPELVYDAPEILEGEDYSEASDVYSYGMILYQIITCLKSFKSSNSIFHTSTRITRGERPEISPNTPAIYSQLIKRCWSQNSYERPTFNEILSLLREDSGYLLQDDSVDQDEIKRYIELVDNALSSPNNEFSKPKESQKRKVTTKILPDFSKTQEQNSTDISTPPPNTKINRVPSRRLINPDVFNPKEVDMPKLIEQLKAENEALRRENASLKRETSDLREENESLRKQLSQKTVNKRTHFL